MSDDDFYILGLNITGPNTSASLLHTMKGVLAFAEEERFTRVKLATDKIPTNAISYCLSAGGIDLDQVSMVTIGWNHNKYPDYMADFYARRMNHPEKDSYSRNLEKARLSSMSALSISKKLKIEIKRSGIIGNLPEICFKDHHKSHAASVFIPSPYQKALTVVVDGSGEEMGTSVWKCERGKPFELICSYTLPDSLGYFYGAITEFLGFSIFTGEGKVMGLAPYGKPNLEIRRSLSNFLSINNDGEYFVDPKYVYFGPRSYSFRHTDYLSELLNIEPRRPESEILDIHKDIAFEAQYLLEKTMIMIVERYIKETSLDNICIAGGVANNCKMNGVISSLKNVNSCFVLPASADSGVSYGSALLHAYETLPDKTNQYGNFNVYLGPKYSNSEIISIISEAKIAKFVEYNDDDLFEVVSELLAQGKIVGWFQGRMEVGARALGNRSILANPSFPRMKEIINRDVKRREYFRPFAPTILEEHAADWLDLSDQNRTEITHKWMIQAAYAKEITKMKAPSIVHEDGSVRPQILCRNDNPRYHRLLESFFEKTQIPLLLNTSLNVRGEPMINKPDEALRCFFSHGLDILVIQNVVLSKDDF
jgi:carbamoyltransferase